MNATLAEETTRCRLAQQDWSRLPLAQRLRCLRRFRHLLVEQAEALSLVITQDIGRSKDEVLATDILPSADACWYLERQSADLLRPRHVPRRHTPAWLLNMRQTVERRPHGLVGIIGTWNYPVFLNAIQILQALAAGNGVLWKPSELTPAFAVHLATLFSQAGFPKDLFIPLPAEREWGERLINATIDFLVFTGSAEVGRKIAARLGERLIPSVLELSGCDAAIVCDDADLHLAARALWYGVTLNQGQTCLAVRRIFASRQIMPELIRLLRHYAPDRRAAPLALYSQAVQAERVIQQAIQAGAELLFPDPFLRAEDDPPRFPPTVVVQATTDMAITQEAAFAPIAALLAYENQSDLEAQLEKCSFALAASIFTQKKSRAFAIAARLRCGLVTINDVIAGIAHPATPFGGHQSSGWGGTQGAEGLLSMTVPRVISENRVRYRPHFDLHRQPELVALLRGLLAWNHAGSLRARIKGFLQILGSLWRSIKPW